MASPRLVSAAKLAQPYPLARREVFDFGSRLILRAKNSRQRFIVFFTDTGALGMNEANSLFALRLSRLQPELVVGVYDGEAKASAIVDDVASMRRCA